ncbi:MAG: winged helix-turn-helix domain-containing protein [Wenzhouxiangella sp.]
MAVFRFGPFDFDPRQGRLEHRPTRQQVTLRPQVARLLEALVERPREVVDRESLCRAVWDEGAVVDFEAGLAAALRELRSEIKALDPSQEWIQTVPRRGVRLAGAVRVVDATGSGSPQRARRFIAAAAVVLVLVVATAMLAWQELRPERPLEKASGTLAVLPFSQFGEPPAGSPRLDLLLADRLLVELWKRRPEGLTLIGRASLAPYAGRDNIAALVARDLGVDRLIEGSVVFEPDSVDVSARLLAMPEGRILWSDSRRYRSEEMASPGDIAAALVDSLVRAWPPPPP